MDRKACLIGRENAIKHLRTTNFNPSTLYPCEDHIRPHCVASNFCISCGTLGLFRAIVLGLRTQSDGSAVMSTCWTSAVEDAKACHTTPSRSSTLITQRDGSLINYIIHWYLLIHMGSEPTGFSASAVSSAHVGHQ